MINEINKDILKLEKIANLHDSSSILQQTQLITKISKHHQGLIALLELLINRQINTKKDTRYIDGIIFKSIYNCKIDTIKNKLYRYFKQGIVKLESDYKIDYTPLYISLISNDLKKANDLTQMYLNKLTQLNTHHKRQWLYFTDIISLPIKDLQTIDSLWIIYTSGKFGFSTQRRIWLCNNKDWDKFWNTIGWKTNKKNLRYPHDFIWDATAPNGHLPLFNQIRGVQVLAKLLTHPAWEKGNITK